MDEPIKIAVMGATGCGKTTFINLASRSNLRIGMDLESCTPEVQLANEFTLDGRRVLLIDTPGFDDAARSDTEILKNIGSFLATTYKKGSRLAGLIYMYCISDKHFSGIRGRNFKIFRELCGETSLKNVVFVTNMWSEVPHDIGEARERELASKILKPALDKGAQMVRNHDTEQSAHDIIRRIVNNHPVVLQIQRRELEDEQKDIVNTAASDAVNAELVEAARRHEAELRRVEGERARALREKEEVRRKVEEERRRREEIRRVKQEEERIALVRRQEIEWAEMKARHLEEEAKMARQLAEEEHRLRVALLNARLAAEAASAEIARVTMEEHINHLQHQVHRHHEDSEGDCVIM